MPTDEERARAKRRAYLKSQGMGGYVDASEMQARIRKLYDVHQVPFQRIADRTGVDLSNVRSHYYGRAITRDNAPLTTCFWKTHNAIMTTSFGPADVRVNIRGHGTVRRLQALIAAGFPQQWLAETTGRSLAHLNRFILKEHAEVSAEHAAVVEQVYRKYSEVDPVDVGVPPRSKAYAQTVAKKYGYHPASCWDEDTIDNPDAIPEYTGECGSEEGYRIHVRESMAGRRNPPCAACKAVVEVTRPGNVGASGEQPYRFRHERFGEVLKERGTNPRQLAISFLGDVKMVDRIYRWRMGDRQPRRREDVYRLASALDVEPAELMEDVPEEELRANTIGHGAFNPYVFKAVIEAAGLSQTQVAKILGVSHSVVGKWVRSEFTPQTKSKLFPLTARLGIDIEVFYS